MTKPPHVSNTGGEGIRPLGIVALLLSALLLVLIIPGCATPANSPSPESRARESVIRYNTLLAEGYRSQNMDELRAVADELQAQDEYIHMSAIAEGKVRLVPTLVALEFVNASMEETSALLQTRETWDFVQESLSTRQPLVRQRGLIYELAWDLSRREDGSWYVKDVRAIETTATAPTEQLAPGAVGGLHP